MTALATSDTSARVGNGARDHGFHHLRRGDDHAVLMAALLHDLTLQTGELREAHLDAQIAARHHHRIARSHHLREVLDRLRALDLGDQQAVAAGGAQQAARLVHVRGVAREGYGQVVDLERGGELDVLPILVGQGAGRESAALAVDALVVAELPAHQHARADSGALDRLHLQADLPVVQQQHVARRDVGGQFLVRDADRALVAGIDIERGIERELGAVGELYLAGGETLDADLRSLQVAEHADIAAGGCAPHRARDRAGALVIGELCRARS
jgi:hypothetical protein